jgi:hypothetical protein
MQRYSSAFIGLLAWAALSGTAQAHIKLITPDAWLNEDSSGGPQKGGPCGPGGFDDVQPVPLSMKVTTVTAGDMLMVEFDETVHHPGWFRIALAEDPKDFEEIEFPNADNCNYDMSKVPTEPHGNVLKDGFGMDTNIGGANRKFMEMVKLPDMPCEKCTLQVIQVMADALHAPPGCVYYHCAELKILPKAGPGAAAGSGGSAAAGSGVVAGAAGKSGVPAAGSGGVAGAVAAGTGGVHAHAAGAGGAMAITGSSTQAGRPATTTPSTPSEGVAGTTAQAAAEPANAGGCSVSRVGSGASVGILWLSLIPLWLTRRKNRL